MAIFVPPAVPFVPAVFSRFMQFVPRMLRLPAVPAVMLDGFVQFLWSALAMRRWQPRSSSASALVAPVKATSPTNATVASIAFRKKFFPPV